MSLTPFILNVSDPIYFYWFNTSSGQPNPTRPIERIVFADGGKDDTLYGGEGADTFDIAANDNEWRNAA